MDWGTHAGRCRIVALRALVALVLAAVAGPTAIANGRSRAQAPVLTAAVERVMRQASIPGAIVGVWQRGFAPYVKAFGVRDRTTRRPMHTNLYMRIGSETKTFVGTALLQLVDQGKVALDSPISSYLSGVPQGDAITLRQLADMRSGLFNYTNDLAFVRAWFAAPRRVWTPHQLLSYGFSKPVLFAPGTGYEYSNTNTVLLGLVVEKVSRGATRCLHQAAHPDAGAPRTHQPPDGYRVPGPARPGLHQQHRQVSCLGWPRVRPTCQRHQLEPVLGVGRRGDDLNP